MLLVKICGHVLMSPVVASRSDIHKSFTDERAIPSTKRIWCCWLAAADSVHWRCCKHQFKSNSSTTMVGGKLSICFFRSPSHSLCPFKDQTKHDKIRTMVTWWRMHIVQKVLLGVGIRQLDGATYKCRLLVSLHWWSRIWDGFLGMFRSLGITYAVSVKREIRRGLYTNNLSFYTS
jgi:hypothetical protein